MKLVWRFEIRVMHRSRYSESYTKYETEIHQFDDEKKAKAFLWAMMPEEKAFHRYVDQEPSESIQEYRSWIWKNKDSEYDEYELTFLRHTEEYIKKMNS
jgi:hypothetical protein